MAGTGCSFLCVVPLLGALVKQAWWWQNLSTFLFSKDFIFPWLLKLSLSGYVILRLKFFSLWMLSIGLHSLLTCRVSAKRSAVSLMGFPLWVTWPFSLAALSIFFLHFNSGESDDYVPWSCSSWGISLWCSLCFLGLNISLPYDWEVLLNNILKIVFQLGFILSVTFRYTYHMYIRSFHRIPYFLEALLISFYSFFSNLAFLFYFTEWIFNLWYRFFCLVDLAIETCICFVKFSCCVFQLHQFIYILL